LQRLYDNGIGQDDDSMHMVRHDDPFVQRDARVVLRDFGPALGGDFAQGGQAHFAIADLPEGGGAVFDANGDEIMAGVAVIPTRQARRFDAVFVFEQGHIRLPPRDG
jgi:hypothetical protein